MANAKSNGAKSSSSTLAIYWPMFFMLSTVCMMCCMDPTPKDMWPPTFELSGVQAKRFLTSPWFLSMMVPMMLGLIIISRFARKNKLPWQEHQSMVWWIVNLFWFHTGCDIMSGMYQVMPVLTQFYERMSPAHLNPRWHESRAHLDAGYALELYVEVPMAFLALVFFFRRDPARHIVEVFAAGVQLAGTVAYYAPGLAKFEAACWLSWMDRGCGAVWVLFPALLIWRHVQNARDAVPKAGKKA